MRKSIFIRLIIILAIYIGLRYFGGETGRQILYPVILLVTYLHELGHASLGHQRYSDDLQLLIMEVQAWREAKDHAKRYGISIDEAHIDECLDSYRQWLHVRSRCIECSNNSMQIDRTTYQCHNCLTKWNVPSSRFCAIRRTRVT